MNKAKLLKLSKVLLQLSETITDKGTLIATEELVVGVEVFIENEGEFIPAADGEYLTAKEKIEVRDGKVESIEVLEESEPVEIQIEESLSKAEFFAKSYTEIMKKLADAIPGAWIVEAGDGWCVAGIYEDDAEKFYRYTYSLDAQDEVILGDKTEVYPRFVTKEEADTLEFSVDQNLLDEKDLRIQELEGLLKDRDAVIAELTEKLKELTDKPVAEPVKMNSVVVNQKTNTNPALKFFQN
jgi:hypothetical protein